MTLRRKASIEFSTACRRAFSGVSFPVRSFARRVKDLEQLHGDELELQQLMWYAIAPLIPLHHITLLR